MLDEASEVVIQEQSNMERRWYELTVYSPTRRIAVDEARTRWGAERLAKKYLRGWMPKEPKKKTWTVYRDRI